MRTPSLEAFLAQLYTDTEVRARFLADPSSEAQRAGLSAQNRAAVLKINPVELRRAARSFAHKRRKRAGVQAKITFVERWLGKLRRWR